MVEEIAGAWLKELLELPAEASFAFVTGCQMAHVTCLAAARHALLERLGWNVEARGLPGVELVSAPVINQALVRFHDPRPSAGDADHDRHTDQEIERIAASGEAFFTGATWRGRRVMRISVSSWRTTEQDVARGRRGRRRARHDDRSGSGSVTARTP